LRYDVEPTIRLLARGDFPRDPCRQVRRIKGLNGSDAGLAGQHALPHMLNADTQRASNTHARHDNATWRKTLLEHA